MWGGLLGSGPCKQRFLEGVEVKVTWASRDMGDRGAGVCRPTGMDAPGASIRVHSFLCDTPGSTEGSQHPLSASQSQPGGSPALTLDCTSSSKQQAAAQVIIVYLEGVQVVGEGS